MNPNHFSAIPGFSALTHPFAVNLTLVGLSPVLAVQAVRVRRTTPILPDAAPPFSGCVAGPGPAVRLLFLGESTVAGVGVAVHDNGLAGRTAAALAAQREQAVAWRVLGRSGATARQALDDLMPLLTDDPVDLVVVALGVNDTIRLTSPRRWREDLAALTDRLRRLNGSPAVLLAGLPHLERFPVLPWPLRSVLGRRSALLDGESAALAAHTAGLWHCPTPPPDAEQFAPDGFHPGAAGYAGWGAALAEFIERDGLLAVNDIACPKSSAV